MIQLLEHLLHSEIPLTKEIGITVTDTQVTLKNNLNHKCTAFGGSIYSAFCLSGCGLLLKKHGLVGDILIQESNARFIKPVEADLSATCSFESAGQKDKFITMFKRKGIVRIKLKSRVTFDNGDHAVFNGSYVVCT